jgi:hypothetical protein
VVEVIKSLGVTDVTYYRWRQEYGRMSVPQAKRLKELEKENERLRKPDLSDLSQTSPYPPDILRSEMKGVTIMEGITLTTEFIGSVFAYLGAIAMLAFVVSGILLGYMAEEERKENRLFRAEWPLPEAEETAEEEEYLMAA